MFHKDGDSFVHEAESRKNLFKQIIPFGVEFLDKACIGIYPHELVLIGAPSGQGKSELCVIMAMSAVKNNKRVHFFALEAHEFEIEQRIKYRFIASEFYKTPTRPRLGEPLTFESWYNGKFADQLKVYDDFVTPVCKNAFKNLTTIYKHGADFTSAKLIEMVNYLHQDTDMIIIDHVHYFDWDDDNDNRAIKEIAKTVRTLCLELNIPIVLVGHLRKKDRNLKELCPGLDEFHGSSDLYKIATKVITMSPGGICPEGGYYTYFRIPKNRLNGGVTRYLGRCVFDEKKGEYGKAFKIGWANSEKFEELGGNYIPFWARSYLGDSDHDAKTTKGERQIDQFKDWQTSFETMPE